MSEQSVIDVFSAWVDGRDGDADSIDALGAALRSTKAARREFVEYALLEASLHRAFILPPPLPWWRKPLGPGGLGAVVVLVALVGTGVAWRHHNAAGPAGNVADVTSGSLQVGGAISRGVPASTDLVVVGSEPATLRLRDGSEIVLRPGSRLRLRPLDRVGRGFEFSFRSGGGDFRLVPGHRDLIVLSPFGGVVATGPNFSISIDASRRKLESSGPLIPYAVPPGASGGQ